MSEFYETPEQIDQELLLRNPTRQRGGDAPEVVGRASVAGRVEPVLELNLEDLARAGRRSPEGLEPVAEGRIPAARIDHHLVSLLTPASFEAEQYRALRHVLERARRERGCSVVAVTSPVAGDGKTTTAINLAGALAQGVEARVLLADADLRMAGVGSQLALDDPDGPGLADLIRDPHASLDMAVRRLPGSNLSVLPAGRAVDAPYEAFRSSRFAELLQAARHSYDYMVLDTPPVVPVPDCRLITQWVDGFLVVVAAHKTPRQLLGEALNVLEPAKLLGLVFNGDDRPLSGYYGYYYGGRSCAGPRQSRIGRSGASAGAPRANKISIRLGWRRMRGAER